MNTTIDKDLVNNLIVCSRYLRQYRHRELGQDRIIKLLGSSYGHMSQKDLQNAMGVKPGTISELVSKLIKRGLIVKEKSDTDKRAYNIILTDDGWNQYNESNDYNEDYSDLFTSLSDTEKLILNSLLDTLNTDWLAKEPDLPTLHKPGDIDLVKNEEGKFDVELSHKLASQKKSEK